MTRADANSIAVRAVRHILEAAHPFDLVVNGTAVRCETRRADPAAWPTSRAHRCSTEFVGLFEEGQLGSNLVRAQLAELVHRALRSAEVAPSHAGSAA